MERSTWVARPPCLASPEWSPWAVKPLCFASPATFNAGTVASSFAPRSFEFSSFWHPWHQRAQRACAKSLRRWGKCCSPTGIYDGTDWKSKLECSKRSISVSTHNLFRLDICFGSFSFAQITQCRAKLSICSTGIVGSTVWDGDDGNEPDPESRLSWICGIAATTRIESLSWRTLRAYAH